jgi:sugar phosphate isomerase/epimerase
MLLGTVTYNLCKDWDLETLITKLEEAKFEAVELRTTHKHGVEPSLNAAERERVRKRFERSKVRLLSYGSVAEFHSPDAAVRKKHVADAKEFIDLAHDTGAWGVKVRPNGLPPEVPKEVTIGRIGESLRELGDYGAGKGVEIWMEVHGRLTSEPPTSLAIMKSANHKNVGVCWNSNANDLMGGKSIKPAFDMLKPYIKNVHINELANEAYPWRELFTLLRGMKYDRYTLAEAQANPDTERFLRWYRALWKELNRA